MTTSNLGTVIIVVAALAGLFIFIALVFYAERHPNPGPNRKITGGIFP